MYTKHTFDTQPDQELAASGVDRLDSKKEFTVFVPKDSAMKKLRKTLKRSSFTRRNRKNFINKHVVSGALDIKTLRVSATQS